MPSGLRLQLVAGAQWGMSVEGTGESRLSDWGECIWQAVFGAATLMVALNIRDSALRIHGFMANWTGINSLITPMSVRVTCGVLGAISMVDVAVSLAQAA